MNKPLTFGMTLVVSLAALSGCGGSKDASCEPGKVSSIRTLRDDRGAVPSGAYITVVRVEKTFRDRLAVLNPVSGGLSAQDLHNLEAAKSPKAKKAAIKAAVADVSGPKRTKVKALTVVVGDEPTDKLVGDFYAAGLTAIKVRANLTKQADPVKALGGASGADVALVPLDSFAEDLGVKLGNDLNKGIQELATAALKKDLALGAPTAPTSSVQVSVSGTLAEKEKLATLSDLAKACGEVSIQAVGKDASSAAEKIADAYDFTLISDPAADTLKALRGKALAAVSSIG